MAKRNPWTDKSLTDDMQDRETSDANWAIGQTSNPFFGPGDLIVHEFPILAHIADHESDDQSYRWQSDSYESEASLLFGPDDHDWYRSIEHALYVERERVTVASRVRQPGEPEPADSPKVLVACSFAATYIWPVFRHLASMGL